MSLEHPYFEDVRNGVVSLDQMNRSARMLVENDLRLVDAMHDVPAVWECRWYNDDAVAGYGRGDAVWVNTEDPVQFVKGRMDEIRSYVVNSSYCGRYKAISSDPSLEQQMFLDMCQGTNGYRRLYYLGELSSRARIRVSQVGGNKTLPSDDSAWADAIGVSSEQSYKDAILDLLQKRFEVALSSHVETYHLCSETMAGLTGTYLLNDFSNIQSSQGLMTHSLVARESQMTGFDSVVEYLRRDDGDWCQWCRLWRSGYLEHGGILKCGIGTVDVSLNWQTESGKQSFVYDYQPVYGGLYAVGHQFLVGGESSSPDGQCLDGQCTYCVRVTPHAVAGSSMLGAVPEIFDVRNDGFRFSNADRKSTSFSYSATGFVTKSTLLRRGIKL